MADKMHGFEPGTLKIRVETFYRQVYPLVFQSTMLHTVSMCNSRFPDFGVIKDSPRNSAMSLRSVSYSTHTHTRCQIICFLPFRNVSRSCTELPKVVCDHTSGNIQPTCTQWKIAASLHFVYFLFYVLKFTLSFHSFLVISVNITVCTL